jgi:eukaryotic-like serine/threonine-protein kinase
MTTRPSSLPSTLTPVRQLGRGSACEVTLVEWRDDDGSLRRGALKRPLRGVGLDEAGVARLLRDEARVLRVLQHPGIPPLLAHDDDGDTAVALLLTFVDGVALEALLPRRAPIDIAPALHVVEALLSILGTVHGVVVDGRPAGIVHRDLGAHNVLIDRGGDVHLIDFGVAVDGGRERWTALGAQRGALQATSPEAARGEDVDARADLFAVAVLAFTLLSGRDPFASRSPRQRLQRLADGDADVLLDVVPHLPSALSAWCARGLARRRDERFVDATTMREALRAASPLDETTRTTARVAWARQVAQVTPVVDEVRTATR